MIDPLRPTASGAPSTGADDAGLQARVAALEAALATQTRRADELARAVVEAEQARAWAQGLLDTLLATMPSGVAVFDANLRFVRVNPVLAAVDSRSTEHYPGQAPTSLHPRFAQLLEPYLRQALESGASTVDLPLHRISAATPAETRDWLVGFHPLLGADGQALGVVAITREETERLRAEQAIRERDVQLGLALEAADLGTLRHDLGGGTVTLDQRARDHFGLPQATVGQAELWAVVHPDDAARVAQAMPRFHAAGGEGALCEEVRVLLDGGAVRWLALRARRFAAAEGPAGRSLQVVGTSQDITARKQAEQALGVKHQQIETILQTMEEGVLAFLPDGAIIAFNAVACRLAGLPPDATFTTLAEAVAAALIAPLDRDGPLFQAGLTPIDRVLRGERFSNLEARVSIGGANEERWLSFSGTPALDADGALILGVLTVREITQRKRIGAMLQAHAEILSRTNAELTRALRLKDEFLTMMSHELRTPLNAVLGFAESMEEGLYGPITERQQRALGQVTQSGRHLLGILSDILDLTRIEAGAVQIEYDLVDAERLCRAALQQVAARAQQRGVRLLHSVTPLDGQLRADEGRLTQILVNLLDNAVKFTPAGGTVGLEAAGDRARGQLALSVWDTGIGIDPADLEYLFQPFTQVDGRLARAHEGIGLGLTLVRRLVELHGGSVQVESAPGRGSRFTVRLACVVAGSAPVPLADLWPGGRAPHVLIADDHERTLAAYADLLARAGCQVVTARSGLEAVARAQAARPDLAVIALQLREPDGLATIGQLRRGECGAVPMIALSALELPGDVERVLAAGAARCLTRPVSGPVLLEVLRAVLASVASQG